MMNTTIFKNIISYINKDDILVFLNKETNHIITSWYFNLEKNTWCEYVNLLVNNNINDDNYVSILDLLNNDNCVYIRIISKLEWCKLKRKENFNEFNKKANIEGTNANEIVSLFNNNIGHTFKYGNDEIGVLVNISISDEDYYYVFLDSNLNIHFESCVGHIKKVTDENEYIHINDEDVVNALNNYFNKYSTEALYSEYYFL